MESIVNGSLKYTKVQKKYAVIILMSDSLPEVHTNGHITSYHK